jgi:hypothetical protein
VNATIEGHNTVLLQTLTGMDEAMARAHEAAVQNEQLTQDLHTMSENIVHIISELRDTMFEKSMSQVLHRMDELGDSGLRDRLAGTAPLSPDDRRVIFGLFNEVDTMLRDHFAQQDTRENNVSQIMDRSRSIQSRHSTSSGQTPERDSSNTSSGQTPERHSSNTSSGQTPEQDSANTSPGQPHMSVNSSSWI